MKNVKNVIKSLLVSSKKFVAGANLVALTAFFTPVSISAASETDSEVSKEKQNRIEKLGYICLDDNCNMCMVAECPKMNNFCTKPCEDVLNKNIDPLACFDKAKEQKLVAQQGFFNAKIY